MRDADIHAAYRLVKKEITKWRDPVLGMIAEQSHDPFQILIACLLSLRTKDHTTAEASHRLFHLARKIVKNHINHCYLMINVIFYNFPG